MPFYLSITGLLARHGDAFVSTGVVGDDSESPPYDADAVNAAIQDAEATINMKLDRRFVLPLPGVEDRADPENNSSVPDILRMLTADIAIYRMAPSHDHLTNEKTARFEAAMKTLSELAETGQGLGVAGTDTPEGEVAITYNDRVLTRRDLGGLL